EHYAWNAKVESEDEYTQMILLTWVKYDQYIQQIMQISKMWNHSIDLNLIYVALDDLCQGNINKTIQILFEFEQWKCQNNNEQKYKKRINEFLEKRCCNHNINLFCMFLSKKYKLIAVEGAALYTVNDGVPFIAYKLNNFVSATFILIYKNENKTMLTITSCLKNSIKSNSKRMNYF
ncbi:hypothetical protein RFI_40250, partial [Reticulomyxa filosa]